MNRRQSGRPTTSRKNARDDDSSGGPRELFQIVVDCTSEHQQRRLYEQLKRKGLSCKVLTL